MSRQQRAVCLIVKIGLYATNYCKACDCLYKVDSNEIIACPTEDEQLQYKTLLFGFGLNIKHSDGERVEIHIEKTRSMATSADEQSVLRYFVTLRIKYILTIKQVIKKDETEDTTFQSIESRLDRLCDQTCELRIQLGNSFRTITEAIEGMKEMVGKYQSPHSPTRETAVSFNLSQQSFTVKTWSKL